jgi:hypothetical protein
VKHGARKSCALAGAPEWRALVARASQKARKVQALLCQARAKSVRTLPSAHP